MKDSKYYKKMLNRNNQKDRGWLNKLLLSIIVMLLCLIVNNFDSDIRESFTKNVLEENINFGYFRVRWINYDSNLCYFLCYFIC